MSLARRDFVKRSLVGIAMARCGNSLSTRAAIGAETERPVDAQDNSGSWSCFRGPSRSGVSNDKGLPHVWSNTQNIVWKTPLPGAGASSPITHRDRVYVTCYSGYGTDRQNPGRFEDLRHHVLCLSRAAGGILWDSALPNAQPDDHYGDFINMHGYASSTPAADESGVYAFFGTAGVRAYGHDGTLQCVGFGTGASLVLFGDLLIVNAAIESESLIAFEKTTGRETWRVPLSGNNRSTPLVLDKGRR
jgi:outer membrane protein assembly factor BamB